MTILYAKFGNHYVNYFIFNYKNLKFELIKFAFVKTRVRYNSQLLLIIYLTF